jgi:hypothetical protein
MPVLHRRTFLLAGLALPGATVARQDPPTLQQPDLFRRVIGNPTGRNGYEELVAAADELSRSELFQQAEARLMSAEGCPLDLKRRVLRDPPAIRALQLVQRGLSKPISWPHEPASLGSQYPELGAFRSLGRMSRMRQDVAFAGGDTKEALALTRDLVRLRLAMKMGAFIAYLTSMALGAIAVRSVGEHMGQLGASDCDELLRIAFDWLRRPDALPHAVDAAHIEDRRAPDDLRSASRTNLEKWFVLSPEDANRSPHIDVEAMNSGIRARIGVIQQIREGPGADEAFATARAWIDDHYDRIALESRRPPWERSVVDLGPGDTPAGRILTFVHTFPSGQTMSFIRDTTTARLLACHAAIWRYRWEHDRLPRDLQTLQLGDTAIDPFTGKLLKYEPSGANYRLASAGPAHRAYDDLPAGRTPVTLVPGERIGLLPAAPARLLLRLRQQSEVQGAGVRAVVVDGLARRDDTRRILDRLAGVQVARVHREHAAGDQDAQPVPRQEAVRRIPQLDAGAVGAARSK